MVLEKNLGRSPIFSLEFRYLAGWRDNFLHFDVESTKTSGFGAGIRIQGPPGPAEWQEEEENTSSSNSWALHCVFTHHGEVCE